jgi:hypothetical protein
MILRSRPSLVQIAHNQLHAKEQPLLSMSVLCDQGAGSGALVSPGWWENTNGLVVARKTVDAGLDENKAELGVLVLSVPFKMLADSNSLCSLMSTTMLSTTRVTYLLDQHVEVLWNLRCEPYYFTPSVKDALTKQRQCSDPYLTHHRRESSDGNISFMFEKSYHWI